MKRNPFFIAVLSFVLCFACTVPLSSCGSSPLDTTENMDSNSQKTTIDIDLTKLSGTMVYSEVYNMLSSPKKYIGKTVKMSGRFTVLTGGTEQFYPAVLIDDATACCAQGFEILLKDKRYPNDYPEINTEISVVGTFQIYYEGSKEYCHLIDCEMC